MAHTPEPEELFVDLRGPEVQAEEAARNALCTVLNDLWQQPGFVLPSHSYGDDAEQLWRESWLNPECIYSAACAVSAFIRSKLAEHGATYAEIKPGGVIDIGAGKQHFIPAILGHQISEYVPEGLGGPAFSELIWLAMAQTVCNRSMTPDCTDLFPGLVLTPPDQHQIVQVTEISGY